MTPTPQPSAPTAEQSIAELRELALAAMRSSDGGNILLEPVIRALDRAADLILKLLARPDGEGEPVAEREACALIAFKDAETYERIGLTHPENSVDRDRCFARARAASEIGMAIRSRPRYAKPDGEAVRAEIVAWLRRQGSGPFPKAGANLVADAIERGDFRQSGEKGEEGA